MPCREGRAGRGLACQFAPARFRDHPYSIGQLAGTPSSSANSP